MRSRVVAQVLCVMILTTAAGCGGKPAETNNRQTPRKAAISLMHLLSEREPKNMKSGKELREFFAKDANPAYVDALASVYDATKKLRKAAYEQLGKDNALQIEGDGPVVEDIKAYEAAEETISGDSATLKLPSGQALNFRKEGQEWKIVPTDEDAKAAAQVLKPWAEALDAKAEQLKRPEDQRDQQYRGDKDKIAAAIRTDLQGTRQSLLQGK